VTLTNAGATYSVLGKNVVVQQNMTFNGRIGIISAGLLNLSNNTIHGRVDYSGAVNHTVSGSWSITGGEVPNFGLVDTAQTDVTSLASTIAALSGTSISNISTSRTLTAGVYDVSKITLTANNNLTFSGSATDQFIVRVSNTFSVNGNIVLGA